MDYWDKVIRGRWFKAMRLNTMPGGPLKIAAVLLLAGGLSAAKPALSELGQGIEAYNARNYTGAIAHLRAAKDVARLSDYIASYLGWSQLLTGDADGALATVTAYRAHPVDSSPLAGKISLLYSRALLDRHDAESWAKSLSVLQTDYKILPQPDGDFALGLAYEALGETQQAALSYENVYYSRPNTDLAAQSWTAMERLREALGKDFPPAPPNQQLERAGKWLTAKEYAKARAEYVNLAGSLPEPSKNDAKVGIGVADYDAGDTGVALRYLKGLHVEHGDADAKRLYFLTEAARKEGDDTAMADAVQTLGERYPKSAWRLKALVAAGNRYVVTNDRGKYEPLFKAAYENFPPDSSTAYSHWKIAWDAYLGDNPQRVALLREQVERYTDDSRAGSALYFLGRIAEDDGKPAEARALYDRLTAQFPHYFYAVLGRERTVDKVAAAPADADTAMWLEGIDWPARRDLSATEANAATSRRIERARLLAGAGLADSAEAEARFGAATGNEQPQLLALELAQAADTPFRALRIMKIFSGDYLSLPLENAPIRFWQMLFPLPYKDEVFENARARGLDPFYVAALIRQESEFNPGAKSRANALGLMQLIPSTGRMVGRKEGMRSVPASLLLNPGVSIRLGTSYLRAQLSSWDGDWFRTLAAYNAGPGRVHEWLAWTDFRKPVEFVESIPFTETREYVQAVLRNADMYRELYSGKLTEPERPRPAAVTVAAVTEKVSIPARRSVVKPARATALRKIVLETRRPPAPKTVKAKTAASKRAVPKKSVAARRHATKAAASKASKTEIAAKRATDAAVAR